MTFNEYSVKAATTAKYHGLNYNSVGFGGEAGEYLNEYKKFLRREHLPPPDDPIYERLLLELGDTLWYMARIAEDLGSSLEEIATMNIDKLRTRHSK